MPIKREKTFKYKVTYSNSFGNDYAYTIKEVETIVKNRLNRKTNITATILINSDYIDPKDSIWNGRKWRAFRIYEYRVNKNTNRINFIKLDLKGKDYRT